jgi:hypothetical protein
MKLESGNMIFKDIFDNFRPTGVLNGYLSKKPLSPTA